MEYENESCILLNLSQYLGNREVIVESVNRLLPKAWKLARESRMFRSIENPFIRIFVGEDTTFIHTRCNGRIIAEIPHFRY